MPQRQPAWLAELSEEDLQFVRRFIVSSGSLKDLAVAYSVSYPTVRARLDRLIAKVTAAEASKTLDPFDRKIQLLVADGKLPVDLAKSLLAAHASSLRHRRSRPKQGAKS
jgi:hypothetical protein